MQTRACVISIGLPSWFKTEIFPTLRRNQLPRPPISKTYRTVTPLCRIEPNRELCEPLHPYISRLQTGGFCNGDIT